ncbi:hypothetical protein ACFPVX_08125 [Cohnella faecalis]|uniref:Uncharacterized protein n=1 Tax=Cohnella faecalis TaxID=2315694 RepID=A0A398CS36_9BACL|nr:hypothetical protein [Cohnella faecalis]RIE04039.1 hypothetical protein D3H35_08790 [Cohnella faecalis]
MLFAKFILASTVEFLSFFIFAMVLFRFSVKEALLKFIIASLIFSFVSNTLQVESLQNISPLVNIFLFVFLITIILRVRLLHSIVMVAITFVAFSLVQWLLLTIFLKAHLFNEILPYTNNGFALQLSTALTLCIISAFIFMTNGGFSYIQSSSRFYKETFKGNRLFFLFLLLALLEIILVNIFYLASVDLPYYIYFVSITIMIILVLLIYFSIRKDGRRDT